MADLKDVMVVSSGDVILSQVTFPEYFVKQEDEDLVYNTENDITVFAELIAPRLHITHRFVGQEPEDIVTDTYNGAMKRILPAQGIEVVEIPRIEEGSGAISASRVRRSIKKEEHIKQCALLPESTKRILCLKNE